MATLNDIIELLPHLQPFFGDGEFNYEILEQFLGPIFQILVNIPALANSLEIIQNPSSLQDLLNQIGIIYGIASNIFNSVNLVSAALIESIESLTPFLDLIMPEINLTYVLTTLIQQFNLIVALDVVDIPLLLSILSEVQQVLPVIIVPLLLLIIPPQFLPLLANINMSAVQSFLLMIFSQPDTLDATSMISILDSILPSVQTIIGDIVLASIFSSVEIFVSQVLIGK